MNKDQCDFVFDKVQYRSTQYLYYSNLYSIYNSINARDHRNEVIKAIGYNI